jgi:hypothetical protein
VKVVSGHEDSNEISLLTSIVSVSEPNHSTRFRLWVKSGEFHDETHWTITLQQPTAVQVEAASGAVVKSTHLCPAKVTVPAQGV